jgi:hypothetical protein
MPPSSTVRAQDVTGVPHVFWQTTLGRDPSGPGAASGSESGRPSLASKSQVQCVVGSSGAQAEQQAQTERAAPTVTVLRKVPRMR